MTVKKTTIATIMTTKKIPISAVVKGERREQ